MFLPEILNKASKLRLQAMWKIKIKILKNVAENWKKDQEWSIVYTHHQTPELMAYHW